MGVPVKTKSLCLVPNELNLSIDLAKRSRVKWVLRPVKDEDLAVHTQSGKDVGVLRLIASLVHLSRVLDLLNNVALDGSDIARLAVAADLASFLIIVVGIGRHSLGDLNIGDLQIVGALI